MENITFGLEVLVIGFTVVMVTLYVLYLILLGFSRCCARPAKPEPKKEQIITPPPAVLDEVGLAPVAAAVSQHAFGTAPEVVAAITAAITACLEMPSGQFEIVSVQPAFSAQGPANWPLSGRKRLMERRQDLSMFRRERRK